MSVSSAAPRMLTPALLIRMSMCPNIWMASWHLAVRDEGSERSTWSTFGECLSEIEEGYRNTQNHNRLKYVTANEVNALLSPRVGCQVGTLFFPAVEHYGMLK